MVIEPDPIAQERDGIDAATPFAPEHQFGDGTTWIFAIMPPSSCSRMWQ
jgi:hypothetical protein